MYYIYIYILNKIKKSMNTCVTDAPDRCFE